MSDPRTYKDHADSGFGSGFGVEGEFGTGGFGDKPFTLVVLPSAFQLILHFGCMVNNVPELHAPTNYTVNVLDGTSKLVTVIKVVPNDLYSPTFVTIETTECTHGGAYSLLVAPGEITQFISGRTVYLGEPDNVAYFTGVEETHHNVDQPLRIRCFDAPKTAHAVDWFYSDHTW